jgi:hypothetical protein
MICYNAYLLWNSVENFFDANPVEETEKIDRLFVLAYLGVFLTGMASYFHSVHKHCWEIDVVELDAVEKSEEKKES